jgi:integrase
MKYHASDPRPYRRRGKVQAGRWEVDLRGTLDNGLVVDRERRVFPAHPKAPRMGKRQAAAAAYEEFERWNRYGQVIRAGEQPPLPRTGAMAPGCAPTFAQFAPDYLEFCESPNASPKGANAPSTVERKENALRLHLLPVFGSMRMDQVQRRDVDRSVINKTKAKRAEGSISNDITTLHHMLTVAKQYGLISELPDFRVPPRARGDIVALDPDERERYVAAIGEHFDGLRAVLLELYLVTGLRCGEGLGLYPADLELDSERPTVRVARTWSKCRLGRPKGRKPRVVPVVPELAAKLDDLLAERGLSPRSTTEHIFSLHPKSERPVNSKTAREWSKKIGKLAQTRNCPTHVLRHTFGTECARRGVPLLTIMAWMGHAKVEDTMRYLHLVAPDHLRWADLLSD